MKFGRFIKENQIESGVIIDDKLFFFKDIFNKNIDLKEFVETFKESYIEVIKEKSKIISPCSIDKFKNTSVFHEPRRNVICLGKNYLEHVNECNTGGIDKDLGRPAEPIFFSKLINKFIGPHEAIELDSSITKSLDYEGELAIIISKEGANINIDEVYEYIFGYTIINDSSARDLQKKHSQWLKGKSLDNTCSIGPYILYKEAISFPPSLDIKTYINKELRQHGKTDDLIFSIAYAISELSKGTTLKKGDIIATGTPKGVGMGFNPPKFLKDGDTLKIEIENIGILENKIKRKEVK